MPAKRWSIWQITFCQLIIVRPEGLQLYHHEQAEPFVELHACKLALRNSGCGTHRLQPHRPQAQPHSAREWGRFATKSRTRPGRLSKKRKFTKKQRSPRSSTRTQKGASCSTILTHSLCILETFKEKDLSEVLMVRAWQLQPAPNRWRDGQSCENGSCDKVVFSPGMDNCSIASS